MPTKANFQRKEAIRLFVQEELDRYKVEDLSNISSNDELVERFGYRYRSGVYNALQETGLLKLRRGILGKNFDPSQLVCEEGAWFLGILSASGSVRIGQGRRGTGLIYFSSQRVELIDRFVSVGQRLLHAQPNLLRIKAGTNDLDRKKVRVTFYHRACAEAVGDLRLGFWDKTIQEQHSWIVKNTAYIWSFLKGFSETRGNIDIDDVRGRRSLILSCAASSSANYLSELLVRVGVDKPALIYGTAGKVNAVIVRNLPNLRLFARNIHLTLPEKEGLLDDLRKREYRWGRRQVFKDNEVVSEWVRITSLLGHSPSYYDIEKLNADGTSRISPKVYTSRFGKGSFVAARAALEELRVTS